MTGQAAVAAVARSPLAAAPAFVTPRHPGKSMGIGNKIKEVHSDNIGKSTLLIIAVVFGGLSLAAYKTIEAIIDRPDSAIQVQAPGAAADTPASAPAASQAADTAPASTAPADTPPAGATPAETATANPRN